MIQWFAFEGSQATIHSWQLTIIPTDEISDRAAHWSEAGVKSCKPELRLNQLLDLRASHHETFSWSVPGGRL